MPDESQRVDTRSWPRWLAPVLLGFSAVVYACYFLHLSADFPNHAPWYDMAKFTDEGWYGNAAAQLYAQGSWRQPDAFNAAVALPVWPAILAVVFKLTGVSMVAARATTVVFFGASLGLLFAMLRKACGGVAAAAAIALVVVNPFAYAFDRQAILEPVLVFWLMLGLWLASRTGRRDAGKQVALGAVITLLVLTKTTAVCLAPALVYQMWATWGWPKRGWVRAVAVVCGAAVVLWLAYFLMYVRPFAMDDYRNIFAINGGRINRHVAWHYAVETIRQAQCVGWVVLWLSLIVIVVSFFRRGRHLWRMPLFGSCVLVVAGYLGFIWFHGNLQPRYYIVVLMPLAGILFMAPGAPNRSPRKAIFVHWFTIAALSLIPATLTIQWIAHPEYTYVTAARAIAAAFRGDANARGPLLGNSASDVSLFTGVPAVCESYTPHGIDALLARYQPNYFLAWSGELYPLRDMKARYSLEAVGTYSAMDPEDHSTLTLYRVHPLP